MTITIGERFLFGLDQINVLLGKNGCGKSTLLKEIDTQLQDDNLGLIKYVTPERGGVLTYEPGVERNMSTSPGWLSDTRRVNQFTQFREQSMAQFRRLEITILRESERHSEVADFDAYMTQLNSLLENIEIQRADPTIKIFSRADGSEVSAQDISSGEAELISLGIEALMFANEIDATKINYLLLDEPDVHLHPDLQARLVAFLITLVEQHNFRVVIATHSTAILGALANFDGATVAFMKSGVMSVDFKAISDIDRRILPVFGAHPLSNVFNERPILVVEGDDDERVWQQAVRSADGQMSIYPVSCFGVNSMSDYEQEVKKIVEAVYDEPQAYSLRDRDDGPEGINDLPPVTRMRLSCRTIENLVLSDEVLAECDLTWGQAKAKMDEWITNHPEHVRHADMVAFKESGYPRKDTDLKRLRNLLVSDILGSTKSWEVLVGKVLAKTGRPTNGAALADGSVASYLGEKAAGLLPSIAG